MARRALALACLLPLLGACNMLVSETPLLGEADRAKDLPKDGLWLSNDPECPVDASQPEAGWPDCALWIVVRNHGRDILLTDGKGQAERLEALFAEGSPLIAQGAWTDTAKEPQRTYYGFYGVEPSAFETNGSFTAAIVWTVECGTQEGSDIRPYPGIGPDCRAPSKDAIRSAARQSRRPDQISEWRWLRAESPSR